jgi:hypothetical protein
VLPLVFHRWCRLMADAGVWTAPVLKLQGSRMCGVHAAVAKGLNTWLQRRSSGFHVLALQASTCRSACQRRQTLVPRQSFEYLWRLLRYSCNTALPKWCSQCCCPWRQQQPQLQSLQLLTSTRSTERSQARVRSSGRFSGQALTNKTISSPYPITKGVGSISTHVFSWCQRHGQLSLMQACMNHF